MKIPKRSIRIYFFPHTRNRQRWSKALGCQKEEFLITSILEPDLIRSVPVAVNLCSISRCDHLTAQCPPSQCVCVLFIPIPVVALNQAALWTDIKKYCLSFPFKWPFNLHLNLNWMKNASFCHRPWEKGLKEIAEQSQVFSLQKLQKSNVLEEMQG